MMSEARKLLSNGARVTAALLVIGIVIGCTLVLGYTSSSNQTINHSEYFPYDGARLYIQVRGLSKDAPVMIWLHGGPGGAERPLFRYFNGDLEKHFVVVYWDQRGAGRSFDSKADPRRLTISQHLADLHAVINHLQ